ncbi:hypothetical protein TRFO_26985 [Tritrichomonas foetus]|uniref:Uncharacterized protein n=1 Tax=Tritrichomonas foetus TaxID=1144522 RepID=A0A1J4K7A3_9EUKA|nr:hypothetical protein TRFO_26985 [Tritrichomonas foetus]|eukprot:OHT05293.1 hypothetical protein TRFO_26985 [Tritrichomonas foetus]
MEYKDFYEAKSPLQANTDCFAIQNISSLLIDLKVGQTFPEFKKCCENFNSSVIEKDISSVGISLNKIYECLKLDLKFLQKYIIELNLIENIMTSFTLLLEEMKTCEENDHFRKSTLKFIQINLYNILLLLLNASDSIIKHVVVDCNLYQNLFDSVSLVLFFDQGILFLSIFHNFFPYYKEYELSTDFPDENFDKIISLNNNDNVFAGDLLTCYLIDFFYDICDYFNISLEVASYIMTGIYIAVFNFPNIEYLVKSIAVFRLLFQKHKCMIIDFIELGYAHLFINLLDYKKNLDSPEIDIQYCKLFIFLYEAAEDDETKIRVLQEIKPELLKYPLKKNDVKQYDISSVIHLIQVLILHDFLSLSDFLLFYYDLILDLLQDSSFPTKKSILKLFYEIALSSSWKDLPYTTVTEFIENCLDVTTPDDSEMTLMFLNGLLEAFKILDEGFTFMIINFYSSHEEISSFFEEVLLCGTEEMKAIVRDIQIIIDEFNPE